MALLEPDTLRAYWEKGAIKAELEYFNKGGLDFKYTHMPLSPGAELVSARGDLALAQMEDWRSSHFQAAQEAGRQFRQLAQKIAERAGVKLPQLSDSTA